MRARKVFQIYAALPVEERRAFGDFLSSPYFGYPMRLADFRQLLESHMLGDEAREMEPEEIWEALPDTQTSFRANGFDKLCSELLAALNEFLAMQAFRSKAQSQASMLLRAYAAHGLDHWFPSTFESLKQSLTESLEADSDGLLAALEMEECHAEYVFRQPRAPRGEPLLSVDDHLNAFFLAKKLELAALVDNYNRSFNAHLKLSHLDFVEEAFQSKGQEFPLIIQLRHLAWQLTSQQTDGHYFELKSILLQQGHQLAMDQLRPLYHIALNHCAYRLNMGELSFEQEMDALQLVMVEREIFQVNGKMPPEQFKNIVQMRLSLGQVKWVERFIAKWGNSFTNDHGGCALIYNMAALHFHQGNFSECVKGMETVLRDFKDDVFYGLDARIYVLMSLFELGKQEDTQLELETRLNAFRIYLLREKRLGERRKSRYANLVKQFRRLVSLSSEAPQKRRHKAAKFLEVLNGLQPVSNRKWFERQVAAWTTDF